MGAQDFVYTAAGTAGSTSQLGPDANPTTPGSGINFTSQLFAGRAIPIWRDPASQIWPVQEALWMPMHYSYGHPTSAGSQMNFLGYTYATIDTSTITHSAWATTSKYTRSAKTIYTAAAAAINRGVGLSASSQSQNCLFWRGNAAGLGGFYFFCRWGMSVYAAGSRAFVGLSGISTTPTQYYSGEPSVAVGDYIGLGMDSGDTTCALFTRDNTTTTKTAIASMPAAATAGAFFVDLYLYAKPNDTVIFYRVDDLVAGTTLVDSSLSTTIPRNTINMAPQFCMGTGTQAVTQTAMSLHRFGCIGQQN